MGHSYNDRTRLSGGCVEFDRRERRSAVWQNSYTGSSPAVRLLTRARLGVQRVGGYAMVGNAPTTYLTSGGVAYSGFGARQ